MCKATAAMHSLLALLRVDGRNGSRVMIPSCTLAAAALVSAMLIAPARGEQAQSGARPAQWAPEVSSEMEFAAPPLYAPGPSHARERAGPYRADPVLVPLPPGVWAAMTGLSGLVVVALWRKHQLREE